MNKLALPLIILSLFMIVIINKVRVEVNSNQLNSLLVVAILAFLSSIGYLLGNFDTAFLVASLLLGIVSMILFSKIEKELSPTYKDSILKYGTISSGFFTGFSLMVLLGKNLNINKIENFNIDSPEREAEGEGEYAFLPPDYNHPSPKY
jgi:hypothetical protein